VSNFGGRRDLHMLTGVARVEAPGPPADGGSIMIVLGTDAPLSERQLRRVAARAALGLGRAGSFAASGSGEYALAFSTAQTVAHRSDETELRLRMLRDDSPALRVPHRADAEQLDLRFLRDDSAALRELFEATADVVQEAVLNSLCAASPMEGRDGTRVEALPYELLERAPGLRRL
jgi:D-aminopeptidase